MFPWYYSTNCTQIWKPKVKGCEKRKRDWGETKERHWLVPVLRLIYFNASYSQQRLSYSTFKNSCVMCGALLRRSRPNTNSPLLRLHTKDKSVRFCFKLLFFCAKNNKLYWITTTINFVNLWSQTSHISSGIIFRGEFDLITILTAVEYFILHLHIWSSGRTKICHFFRRV